MPPVPPQQKIQYAKQMLEDNNEARTIKDDKISNGPHWTSLKNSP